MPRRCNFHLSGRSAAAYFGLANEWRRHSHRSCHRAGSGFARFLADKRGLYSNQGIESRVCGRWLVTYMRPDAGGATADGEAQN